MNEITLYSIAMFWAGVLLTKAVFYFDQKNKEKKFYLLMSATILQVLDSVHSVHMAGVEYALSSLKKTETLEQFDLNEYLKKEEEKVSVFMEIYTLLFIKAVPLKGRKYINYRTWPQARLLIEELRGVMKNGKDKG